MRDPKIRRIFDQWKGTEALDSPMEKNEDLKAVMLEETPWVRQAQERKRSATQRWHPVRRQSTAGRDDATAATSRRLAIGGRLLALVSRRSRERLHHALHHDGIRSACGILVSIWTCRWPSSPCSVWIAGSMSGIAASWIGRNEMKSTCRPRIALYLYGRSFFLDDMPIAQRIAKKPSTTSWPRRASTGCSWPTASRKHTWPSP